MNDAIRTAIILTLAIVTMNSCSVDEGPFFEMSDGGIVDDSVEVSFQRQVQPILNSYCTRCHGTSHKKLILLTGTSYDQLLTDGARAPYVNPANPEGSILMGYLNGKPALMPPSGPIPDFEKQVILKWIKDGAKNN